MESEMDTTTVIRLMASHFITVHQSLEEKYAWLDEHVRDARDDNAQAARSAAQKNFAEVMAEVVEKRSLLSLHMGNYALMQKQFQEMFEKELERAGVTINIREMISSASVGDAVS